ncbi:hypothetical protein [Nonomuraea sp. CA-141351]|uniref:hypothetical protein n=1 Tax=Nonomuraea sp. CA-141351 TaxID=3239996 RepID=UPI003D932169
MTYKLPDETYRVYPESWNFRNVYDSRDSARRAVSYRKGTWERDRIRVFRAVTVWEDVTHEFVTGG